MKSMLFIVLFSVHFSSQSDPLLCKGCNTIVYDEGNFQWKKIAFGFETCRNFTDIGFDVKRAEFSGCSFYGLLCLRWYADDDCTGSETYWSCHWHKDNEHIALYKTDAKSRSILMRLTWSLSLIKLKRKKLICQKQKNFFLGFFNLCEIFFREEICSNFYLNLRMKSIQFRVKPLH